MKNSIRLLIAIALTLVVAIGAGGTWAGPARQGTVPIFPKEFTGSCGENQTINFGTGTVTALGSCEILVTVPDLGETGPLPKNRSRLFDYVSVTVISGTLKSVKVCVPLAPDWQDKKFAKSLDWYVWTDGKWTKAKTSIEQGPPELVCGSSKSAGIFTLLGK